MTAKTLMVVLLLIGFDPGSECVAKAVCACHTEYGTSVSCHPSDSHGSAPCKMGACRPHDNRWYTRIDTSDSRMESKQLSDGPGAFISNLLPPSAATPSGRMKYAALFLPHPFPEASPAPFLRNCSFLC